MPMLLTCSSTAAPRLLISCNGAAKAALAERDHRFDGVGGFERDVVEDEIGDALFRRLAQRRAVGEFHGVDAGAVQHQRQEMPDAGFLVDHVTERGGAGRRKRRGLDDIGERGVGLGRRFCGGRGHGNYAHSNCELRTVEQLYWCSKLVKYEFPRPAGTPRCSALNHR